MAMYIFSTNTKQAVKCSFVKVILYEKKVFFAQYGRRPRNTMLGLKQILTFTDEPIKMTQCLLSATQVYASSFVSNYPVG